MTNSTLSLAAALAVLVLTPATQAQQQPADAWNYQTGDPVDWPPEWDAVAAAPENHRVLLENDHVRVLEVTVGPGEVEPVHHHRWPSVLHITAMGDFIDRSADGEVLLDTRQLDAPLPIPFTMWKEPEAPHTVENLSRTQPIRLVRVELKSSAADPAASRTAVEYLTGAGVLPSEPALPFSDAVRVGDTVFLSGMIGLRPGTMELVPGGIEAEARQTMENVAATLRAHGLGLDDVVKCTVMMADIAEWGAFNAVYAEFFAAPYPARSAFGADGLALGARVEVECIAAE